MEVQMKKPWSKPQLIVLHRDTAEAVLAVCKTSFNPPSGPTTSHLSACYQVSAGCVACSAQAAS
jgi:hypothetical protein